MRSVQRFGGFGPLARRVSQVGLGLFLLSAGTSHLTVARLEFQAQVPSWVPVDADAVVLASGVVEIALGLALLSLWRVRRMVGIVTALFFVLIFPGNIHQFVAGIDAFGLDSDLARGLRLLGQPILVAWALWATDAMPLASRVTAANRGG
ncbi:MAG: hypothetical protein EBX81_01295 [bacterium]|nr:hypothetical protein [Candidatus Aquidulcis sp.]